VEQRFLVHAVLCGRSFYKETIMTHASKKRISDSVSSAVMQSLETRQLLAFVSAGAPTVVGPATSAESVDSLSNGQHVIAFTNAGDVYIRLYDPAGVAVGASATKVNTTTGATNPDVAFDSGGNIVVAWQGTDADASGIFVQRFGSDLTPVGAETPVNASVTGAQVQPRVAVAADGRATVIWQSAHSGTAGVYAQRYTNAGVADGGEVLVSDGVAAINADVDATPGYASVVTWQGGTSIKAQRFDSSGAAVGSVITVAASNTAFPSVGIAGNGSFVVAFEDTAGALEVVKARRFDNAGAPLAGAFTVSNSIANDQQAPLVDAQSDGAFVVGWAQASTTPDTFDSLAFRGYGTNGLPGGATVVASSIQFDADNRFGLAYRQASVLRLGVLSASNAQVQTFNQTANTIDLTAAPGGSVIQVLGSANNVRVIIDGVTTDYGPPSDFGGVVISGSDAADFIRAKNLLLPVTIIGGAGDDTLVGSFGNDSIDGGPGNDNINTAQGDDYAIGGDDSDSMYGGDGSDTLTSGGGKNFLYGENGADLLTGGRRADVIYGGPANDRIRGGDGGDALFGQDGDDSILGQGDTDAIYGGRGADTLSGGLGRDRLFGQNDNDQLFGDEDVDILNGGRGIDLLNGGSEADYGFYDSTDLPLISVELKRFGK